MNKISKKRNTLKTYLSENRLMLIGVGFVLGIIAFFILSYIVGCLVGSKDDGLWENMFGGMFIACIGIIALLVIIAFVIVIIGLLEEFCSKQKAIYNYIHLPLSSDELRQMLAEKKFEANTKSYLEYLDNQLIYKSRIFQEKDAIQLKPKDVLILLRTIKEVFGDEEISAVHKAHTGEGFLKYQCLEEIVYEYAYMCDALYLRLMNDNNTVIVKTFKRKTLVKSKILKGI